MRKRLLIIVGIVIILMLGLNVFVYISNSNVSSTIEENSKIQFQITKIDDFRTYVVEMANMQKLYLLTKDENYKTEYENYLNNLYTGLNSLDDNKYITSVEKEELLNTINDYRDINIKIFSQLDSADSNNEIADNVLESNNIQLELLHKASLTIASVSDATDTENTNTLTAIDIQNKVVQGMSTLITIITAVPLYYYKKKLNKENVEVKDILNSILDNGKKEKVAKSSEEDDWDMNDGELKEIRQKINQQSLMVSYITLLVKHNEDISNQWKESEAILKNIEDSLVLLREKIDEMYNH